MPKKSGVKITCPSCNKSITLDEVLTQQIEEKIKKEFESELKESEKKFSEEIKKAKSALAEKEKQMETLEENLNEKLKSEFEKQKKKLEEIRLQLRER